MRSPRDCLQTLLLGPQFDLWAGCQLGQQLDRSGFASYCCLDHHAFIVFYLLRDGKNLKGHIVRFLPTKIRKSAEQVLSDVNTQLSNYVRGQITVAIVVAIMFIIFFKIIGLRYAVTLGISAGILNLIPYLGSFLAMLPALVLGLV